MDFPEILVPTFMLISLWTAIPAMSYFLIFEFLPDVQTLRYPPLASPDFLDITFLI